MTLANAAVRDHAFLKDMFDDPYFPDPLVEKGKQILIGLCERIENEQPADTASVLALTHAATEQFNELQDEFTEQKSEIETAARETISDDFCFILESYGFVIDREDAIAPRDW